MQHTPSVYCLTVILFAVLIGHSETKRGCALYGHSCYGGHGKRSDIPIDLNRQAAIDRPFNVVNKDAFYANDDSYETDRYKDNRWKTNNALNLALYNWLRRWINERGGFDDKQQQQQKLRQQQQQQQLQERQQQEQLSDADTAYKSTFV